jgi:hypothetical protein
MELTDASISDRAMHRGQSEVWECPNGHIQASAGATARAEFTAGGGFAGVREPRRPRPSAPRTSERLRVDAIDGRGAVERVTAVLDAAGVHIRKLHVDAADGRVSVQVDVGNEGDIGERVLTSVDAEWVVRRETL